jgi:hypothetical protein
MAATTAITTTATATTAITTTATATIDYHPTT